MNEETILKIMSILWEKAIRLLPHVPNDPVLRMQDLAEKFTALKKEGVPSPRDFSDLIISAWWLAAVDPEESVRCMKIVEDLICSLLEQGLNVYQALDNRLTELTELQRTRGSIFSQNN